MNHIILSVDPGIHSGYAILKVESDVKCDILEYGIIDMEMQIDKNDCMADTCLYFQTQIKELIQKWNVTDVCFEDYFFSKKTCTGAYVNVWLRCSIALCVRPHLHYSVINISEWKRYIAGYVTPSRLMVKKYTKKLALKYMIQEALWVRYNIRFCNHSISTKTGKPVTFKSDQVDAVAIGIFHASTITRNHRLQVDCSFKPPSDIMTKLKSYNYNDVSTQSNNSDSTSIIS